MTIPEYTTLLGIAGMTVVSLISLWFYVSYRERNTVLTVEQFTHTRYRNGGRQVFDKTEGEWIPFSTVSNRFCPKSKEIIESFPDSVKDTRSCSSLYKEKQ